MNSAELARRIRLGEDSTLELKRVVLSGGRVTDPRRDAVADELAALANARGGMVVLGVDDQTREVLGIPLEGLDTVEGWVREICNDSMKPALDADIYRLELNDVDGRPVAVIRVDIPRSLFVHRSPGGYFRRIGSSKREMSPEVLARLFQERSQSRVIRFDETVVPHTAPEDLDYALTRRFLRGDSAEEGASATAARKLRLVVDDDAAARLTLAGVLLCTRKPQRWLPNAYVQAVSYAGERSDVNYQTDARDIGGPLDEQIGEALHFVRRNMLVRAAKTPCAHGAPAVRRAGGVRGAGERGSAPGLLGSGRAHTPAPVRGSSRALRPRRARQHPHPGQHAPAAGEPERADSVAAGALPRAGRFGAREPDGPAGRRGCRSFSRRASVCPGTGPSTR